MVFEISAEPRFCETDALGHINHSRLPQWFEAARDPIFRLFNDDLDLDKWNLILGRIEVDYVAQIHLGATVTVRTELEKIGNSSFVVLHTALQKGEIVAKGRVVMIHFDYQTQRSAPIPKPVRASLEPLLVSETVQ